jgi:hypothetical protein
MTQAATLLLLLLLKEVAQHHPNMFAAAWGELLTALAAQPAAHLPPQALRKQLQHHQRCTCWQFVLLLLLLQKLFLPGLPLLVLVQ